MAEADLESVIRQTAKAQNKALMEAAKKRHGQLMAKAASAKDKEAKARLKLHGQKHHGARDRDRQTIAEFRRERRRQLCAGDQEGAGSAAGQEAREDEGRLILRSRLQRCAAIP